MSKYLDQNGLLYFWTKLKGFLGEKVDKVEGKGLSANDFTTTLKNKLDGIESGANKYTLPTAAASTLGGIKVGNNLTIGSDGTLSAVQGVYTLPTASSTTKGGVKIGTNLSMNGEVLSATDTTYAEATTTVSGLMSASDKTKIDGIESGANKYTLPTASSTTLGGIKVGTNLSISSGVLSATDTTYSDATTSTHGLMSTADKTKLDGVATGATKVIVDSALSSSSTNAIQNKAVYDALDTKVDKVSGKQLSTNDYTTDEKTKLSGIEAGANKYTLPTASASVKGGIKVGTNLSIDSSTGILSATDTTYSDVTTSTHGLMTAADKTKLDGIESGANKYTLPTAGTNSLGGVKTTSTVDSTSGLTACPIISGNVYYKDTNTTYNDATSSVHGLMSTADKSKLDAFGAASTYALKSEITGVYRYKGSVATYADLPTTGLTAGDVYDVQENGQNYAWTGTAWDSLGEVFTITAISNSEIDTILAS